MENFPMQNITIYHKNGNKYERYVKEASYRNTSIINRVTSGVSNSDTTLIRIFDLKDYKNTWFVAKGDVIVNKEVEDEIESTPITQLSNKYGRNNVHQVTSIDEFIFGEELDHVKIGAV